MAYDQIVHATDGPIGYLTLNNPGKINALSMGMIGEIIDALHTVAADDTVAVLVIKAAGKHFCAGHNLTEMIDGGMKDYKQIFDQCSEMMQLIHDIPQPVIAQVQGIATAAGCQLVAWCDLAVAEEGARFATPGVKIGLFCTTPMIAITRAIGRKAAMEMLLTGRYVPASEAKSLGLVNRVVPAGDLDTETEALARQVAEASSFVLGIGKQAFYAQIDMPDHRALRFATQTMVMNNTAEDAQAGIKAFLNKETPEWKHR
ncbi:Enoyl-CoA hydratase (EC [Olavius algarvensis associated proteobacterium Delta 3]|nr:Enoyl-CoA hydratase (EC [Olavius algarvensis associated proteobacterium Delta 3]CAB5164627.1 Enoyl-CoA hydratase (EC [Olavius algarvensis associated proteobacterium Delta 3]